jgi:hypothetical protein
LRQSRPPIDHSPLINPSENLRISLGEHSDSLGRLRRIPEGSL